MEGLAIPFAVAAFAWWFSTGAILWLVHHARLGDRDAIVISLACAGLAVAGLAASADQSDAMGAYCAFGSALLLWGAIELSFLSGLITGPNRAMCPAQARGVTRFVLATKTVIHHELLIAACGLALALFSLGKANPTAVLIFAILAGMRLSAKLNIFLGAPNLAEEFMPARLSHLRSYFRRGAFNPLFPVTMLAGALVAGLMIAQAVSAPSGSGAQTGAALAAALTLLALLEHAFMMTPFDDGALWRWAAGRRSTEDRKLRAPNSNAFQTTLEARPAPVASTLFT
jgi:putative photosynthetic complex assembly protein 2